MPPASTRPAPASLLREPGPLQRDPDRRWWLLRPGAISCRQGEEAWKAWKAGQCGNISLSHGLIEFTNTHQKNKGAFLTFQKDADQIYPGWKEKLGYTGESSVQAASFDWAKKA